MEYKNLQNRRLPRPARLLKHRPRMYQGQLMLSTLIVPQNRNNPRRPKATIKKVSHLQQCTRLRAYSGASLALVGRIEGQS